MSRKQDIGELKERIGSVFFEGIKNCTLEALLSRYSFIRALGAGGNASVFEAERKSDSLRVAVKVLRCSSPEKKARFDEEIEILTEWNGKIKGLMPILESNANEAGYWYEMPVTVSAESILSKLGVKERIDKSVEIVRSCSETLAELHKNGISHRDIKPDNIHILSDEFLIGDFGLVEIPESDDLTRSDVALGAVFTMAPEMRRNPKIADGRKADVYSLAKTLWMFIKNDRYGFDGPYNWDDERIGLRRLSSLEQKVHLSELELLIHDSTDNDPDRRPTMDEVVRRLDAWIEIERNPMKIQISEWNFLKLNMFGKLVPHVAVFEGYDTIFKIMKMICATPAFNHTLFSYRGGLDLLDVERASEKDNITLIFDHDIVILKPRVLQVGVFEESELNYFLLDAEAQSQVDGIECFNGVQNLVEDVPGHYVSDIDAVYGVYDYDEGSPFPIGWRCVTRLTSGRLLIVSKSGPYNSMHEVYDGRHADCSMHVFHKYIEMIETLLKELASKGCNWRDVDLSKFCEMGKNPFQKQKKKSNEVNIEPSPPRGFLSHGLLSWNFLAGDVGEYNAHKNAANFSFSLTPNHFDFSSMSNLDGYKLCKDGRLYEASLMPQDSFTTESLSEARHFVEVFQKKYDEYCAPYYRYDDEINFSFEVCIENVPNTILRLSKQDILDKALSADDRIASRFVVDEDGQLLLLVGDEAIKSSCYPVRMEMFEPRCKNVGKYSVWSDKQVGLYYNALCNAWHEYCDQKRFVFCDCI